MFKSLAFITPAAGMFANQTAAEYSVLLIGDWGGSSDSSPTTSTEVSVISAMANTAQAKGSQFTVLLGDNFYSSGITSKHRSRFESGFENAFPTSQFNMPFYATAGNHDHRGDVSVQTDYHQQGSGRWNFPSKNYNIDKTLPDGKTLRIVMFDSVDIAGLSEMADDGTIVVPDGPANLETAASGWTFVEQSLSESNADYLFTAAHYPAYSGCQHGSVLKSTLPGLLTKYNAIGHLSGHDHCLEHIEKDGHMHVVSGAGSDNWYSFSSISGAKFHMASDNHGKSKGGYAELSFGSSGVQVTYYDEKGSSLYSSSTFAPRSTGSVYV